jgi:CheY-like chemotaxis protein
LPSATPIPDFNFHANGLIERNMQHSFAGRDQRRIAKPPGAPWSATKPQRSRNKQQRSVLVAETDPETCRLCRMVLEDSGFSVDIVESGIAAVIAARERQPECIILDVQLPDVPGLVAIDWLRSNPALRNTPIILLTSQHVEHADTAAIQPLTALRKPISAGSIRQILATIGK